MPKWSWPVNSTRITQAPRKGHQAVDIGIPVGSKLVAPTSGKVVSTGNDPGGYGKNVRLQTAEGYTIILAHLSQINVKPGQDVKQGQTLGKTGNTGNSTGPHLHYEVRGGGNPDPRALTSGKKTVIKSTTSTTPKTVTEKTTAGAKKDTSGDSTQKTTAARRGVVETVIEGVAPDLQVNWGNLAVGFAGVLMVGVGLFGLIIGESAKLALTPITEAIRDVSGGE